jgi:hypothetical protein
VEPPVSHVPYYIYPGQAFSEMASLNVAMPNYPALAFSLANTPGSRDAVNTLSRAIMESGTTPYGE